MLHYEASSLHSPVQVAAVYPREPLSAEAFTQSPGLSHAFLSQFASLLALEDFLNVGEGLTASAK